MKCAIVEYYILLCIRKKSTRGRFTWSSSWNDCVCHYNLRSEIKKNRCVLFTLSALSSLSTEIGYHSNFVNNRLFFI